MTEQAPNIFLNAIYERGWLPNIGQLSATDLRDFNRRVRSGELAKYRGHWDTGLPFAGIGPLKTIFALPEVAASVTQ